MVVYPIYPWIRCQYKIHEFSNNWICIRHQSETVTSIYSTTKCTNFIDTLVINYRVHLGSDRLTKCFRIPTSLSFNIKPIIRLFQAVLAYFDVLLKRWLLFFTLYNLKRRITCWFTSRVSIRSLYCHKSFMYPQCYRRKFAINYLLPHSEILVV